jgi:hypothetical protein
MHHNMIKANKSRMMMMLKKLLLENFYGVIEI